VRFGSYFSIVLFTILLARIVHAVPMGTSLYCRNIFGLAVDTTETRGIYYKTKFGNMTNTEKIVIMDAAKIKPPEPFLKVDVSPLCKHGSERGEGGIRTEIHKILNAELLLTIFRPREHDFWIGGACLSYSSLETG
jgi:hypothetical protein